MLCSVLSLISVCSVLSLIISLACVRSFISVPSVLSLISVCSVLSLIISLACVRSFISVPSVLSLISVCSVLSLIISLACVRSFISVPSVLLFISVCSVLSLFISLISLLSFLSVLFVTSLVLVISQTQNRTCEILLSSDFFFSSSSLSSLLFSFLHTHSRVPVAVSLYLLFLCIVFLRFKNFSFRFFCPLSIFFLEFRIGSRRSWTRLCRCSPSSAEIASVRGTPDIFSNQLRRRSTLLIIWLWQSAPVRFCGVHVLFCKFVKVELRVFANQ